MQAYYKPYQLTFKNPVLTSRGGMQVKNGYYLFVTDGNTTGIGECSFIEGLSMDDLENYEQALKNICQSIEQNRPELLPDFQQFPSLAFGYQTALLDFENGGKKILFESDFTSGKDTMPINGLIWMGEKDFMLQQIRQKLSEGFKCIKIKVGAINFEEEIKLIAHIRNNFSEDKIEIRLDANGAFIEADALIKLERLSAYQIHSIEQPVKQGQIKLMQQLCNNTPIPIALDEELIGVSSENAAQLLNEIKPQYIILKPSLLGGLNVCENWIKIAYENNISWWATSALESNIGLNAIAQWVYIQKSPMVQGLGTGGLYINNVNSPLQILNGTISYNPIVKWGPL